MSDYKQLLLSLYEQEKREFGESFLFAGSDHEELKQLVSRAKQELNITLDSGYIHFLEFSNGLDYDGLHVYGCERYQSEDEFQEGFIEANAEFWQEPSLQNYISYGDENSTRLVFNLASGCFEIIDRVAWDAISQHDTFDDMLMVALQDHL